MSVEARLLLGLVVALGLVHLTTPLAIRIATRLEFYDRPIGYKAHVAPTPYLGGAAVVAGFLAAVVLLTGEYARTVPLAAGVLVLWAVGTIDDRRMVTPWVRIAVEAALAAGLWAVGLGWSLGAGPLVDLVVSAFWVVAIVNAVNLFDNMDGAASSIAAVASAGLALLGLVADDEWLAVCAVALCGACIGFLPHNLFATPARIFLGDGGSMPVGFALAALTMAGISATAPAWQSLAMGLLFVGIPAMDTALVIVSRRRRGLSILTGGRDHLTHRAYRRLGTARAVALTLGSAQATISVLAVVAIQGGPPAIVLAVVGYLVLVSAAIVLLDTRLAPVEGAGRPATAAQGGRVTTHGAIPGWLAVLPLLAIAAALGTSPFFFAYYDSAFWVPGALALLVLVTAGAIAKPPRLGGPARLVLGALAGIGVLALASSAWTDSIEQATVDGNRWLAYLVLTGALIVLTRGRTAALWLLGGIGATGFGVAALVLVRMLDGDVGLFVGGRLHEPLGYINGEGCFFLLALWPCLAAAERSRTPLRAGAGMASAVVLGALALLSQSRGVALAAFASALAVLALVPGRKRRAWALLVLGGALAAAGPALLDVYAQATGGRLSGPVVGEAARMALVAAAGAGALWALAVAAGARLARAVPSARHGSTAALAAILLLAAVAAATHAGAVARTLERQYTAFVHLREEAPAATSGGADTRLVSGVGNRHDYWRVALRTWRSHPLAGIGAGNFDEAWFAERSVAEDVRQPHSLELQLLSELGLLGFACFVALVLGGGWGAWRAARGGPSTGALAVAAIGIFVAWIVHTSVDWMHLLPGVTGVALAALVALVHEPERPSCSAAHPRGLRLLRPAVAVFATGAVLAVAAVSLAREGMAEHFRRHAQASLAADPAGALRDADRSLRLDSEAVGTYYVKAAALARFDQGDAARRTLLAAAAREPRNFVTWALLGDLSVRMRKLGDARAYYRRAAILNPRDPSLRRLRQNPRPDGAP